MPSIDDILGKEAADLAHQEGIRDTADVDLTRCSVRELINAARGCSIAIAMAMSDAHIMGKRQTRILEELNARTVSDPAAFSGSETSARARKSIKPFQEAAVETARARALGIINNRGRRKPRGPMSAEHKAKHSLAMKAAWARQKGGE